MEKAYERKKLTYAELEAETDQSCWKAWVCPEEVGCKGFVAPTFSLLITGRIEGVQREFAKDGKGNARRGS